MGGSPATATQPATIRATRYVLPLREGGSLPALMEASDDGLYVVKFRGAGQGPKALVAELIAGERVAAAVRALRLDRGPVEHCDPALGGARGPVRRPASEARAAVREAGGIGVAGEQRWVEEGIAPGTYHAARGQILYLVADRRPA